MRRGRTGFAAGFAALLCKLASAGGPEFVAGASYFDPATKGTPLTWAQGAVTYYTDQGNLSAILPGPSADSFVADAFSQWSSIPTRRFRPCVADSLPEDVSGANVMLANGALTMPADILPSATATPVGIVYDFDGAVTDALLGTGASDSAVLRHELRLWRDRQPGDDGGVSACADRFEWNLRADVFAVAGFAISPGAGDWAGAGPRLVAGESECDHAEPAGGCGGLCGVSGDARDRSGFVFAGCDLLFESWGRGSVAAQDG